MNHSLKNFKTKQSLTGLGQGYPLYLHWVWIGEFQPFHKWFGLWSGGNWVPKGEVFFQTLFQTHDYSIQIFSILVTHRKVMCFQDSLGIKLFKTILGDVNYHLYFVVEKLFNSMLTLILILYDCVCKHKQGQSLYPNLFVSARLCFIQLC